MLAGVSLEAGRDVEDIFVIVRGDEDSWNFLFQVVFNELDHNSHFPLFLLLITNISTQINIVNTYLPSPLFNHLNLSLIQEMNP